MKESAVPANAMGASSSSPGTGGIDLYDPLLFNKVLSRLQKQKERIRKKIDAKRKKK
jgi:hypothetical protein